MPWGRTSICPRVVLAKHCIRVKKKGLPKGSPETELNRTSPVTSTLPEKSEIIFPCYGNLTLSRPEGLQRRIYCFTVTEIVAASFSP